MGRVPNTRCHVAMMPCARARSRRLAAYMPSNHVRRKGSSMPSLCPTTTMAKVAIAGLAAPRRLPPFCARKAAYGLAASRGGCELRTSWAIAASVPMMRPLKPPRIAPANKPVTPPSRAAFQADDVAVRRAYIPLANAPTSAPKGAAPTAPATVTTFCSRRPWRSSNAPCAGVVTQAP